METTVKEVKIIKTDTMIVIHLWSHSYDYAGGPEYCKYGDIPINCMQWLKTNLPYLYMQSNTKERKEKQMMNRKKKKESDNQGAANVDSDTSQ